MNEFELIKKYFTSAERAAGEALGVGDDACLLIPSAQKQLAVSVDTLVAGTHFPAHAPAELVAARALRTALSDLAAMGAEARWFTLALTLPDVDEAWLQHFSEGLFETANQFSCALVGGDTTKGPLSVSIQVIGEVDKESASLRSGATPGDAIYVTGTLGDAAAALRFLDDQAAGKDSDKTWLVNRYYLPEPRFREAKKLAGLASAVIDVSDGLLADLGHICEQSHVGAEIDIQQLPLSSSLKKQCDEAQAEEYASLGGDDYELCFTVPDDKILMIDEMTLSGTLIATRIGNIVEGEGVQCYRQDKLIKPAKSGYLHFE